MKSYYISYQNKTIIFTVLMVLFFFFSGFARLPQTKILGIQTFVWFAASIILITPRWKTDNYPLHKITRAYTLFLLWSIPGLFMGLFAGQKDALYFYLYTAFPLCLYYGTKNKYFNLQKLLLAAQASLLLVIFLGWAIRLEFLPYNFLYSEVMQSEFKLGYWGISYLGSSRNHDYMYVFACASFSLYLYQRAHNKLSKAIEIIIFLLCQITLLASLSRGAMIICILNFIILYLSLDKGGKRAFWLFFILFLLIGGSYLYQHFGKIYSNIFKSIFGLETTSLWGGDYSNDQRKDIIKNALFHGISNPIGYGIQNYKSITGDDIASSENGYLTILIERGWLSFYYFATFLIRILYKIYKREITNKNLNFYLVPALAVYFLFNYEFTAYMCVFLFYLILISNRKDHERV